MLLPQCCARHPGTVSGAPVKLGAELGTRAASAFAIYDVPALRSSVKQRRGEAEGVKVRCAKVRAGRQPRASCLTALLCEPALLLLTDT